MELLDKIQGPVDYILNQIDLRSRSLEVNRSESFLHTTQFKIIVENHNKN